jgi:hypothetical protein
MKICRFELKTAFSLSGQRKNFFMQAVNILFTVHSQFKKFSITGNSNKYANFWNAEIDRGFAERPVNYW